jgi:2,4-dienoyl-CoA reductase-like NADH-dependent reductase (Old Yellow Enzyme family)
MGKGEQNEMDNAKAGCSRRSFLKGAAATAIGTAATMGGVFSTGCAPSKTASRAGDAASAGTQTTASTINPQDDSYLQCTTDYSAIFQPLQIGKLKLRNRIVKSAAGSDSMNDSIGAPALDFYGNIAKGGAAMLWVESCNVFTDGTGRGKLTLQTDADCSKFTPLTDVIHENGAYCGMQVYGFWSKASSSVEHSSPYEMAIARKALTTDDVKSNIEQLVAAAARMKKAGFDGIDINASCDHMFAMFLSRYWNTERTDQYGPQSLENRARIVTELIQGIKQTCGSDFVVQVLYSGVEEVVSTLGNNAGCTSVAEAAAFAKLFEKAGADSLQIRSACFGHHASGFLYDSLHIGVPGNTGFQNQIDYSRHLNGKVIGSHGGAGALLDVAKEIKAGVSIPVGAVGVLDPRLAPDMVNDAIANGNVDFLCMNRPLFVDPEMPNKLKDGRRDEVAPCNHCLTCFESLVGPNTPETCRVNATVQRACLPVMPEGSTPTPAKTKKNVMVIGGGPAGMETARIAAERGHEVTLYEKSSSLGGMMTFAASIKGSHEKIGDFQKYLVRQQDVKGVTVVTGQEVDASFVDEKKPDTVIVATGAVRPEATLSSSSGVNVVQVQDVASSEIGDTVVIVGANFQATDTAMFLLNRGKKCIIVNSGTAADIDKEQPGWIQVGVKSFLQQQGARVFNSSKVASVGDFGVTVSASYGATEDVPCNTVIECPPMNASKDLYDALSKKYEAYMVGNCSNPSTIADAIANGNLTARKL